MTTAHRKHFSRARVLAGSLSLITTISFAVWANGPLAPFIDGGKIEPVGAFADAAASDALKKALEPKGYRVSTADGTVLCDIWLRHGVVEGKNDAQGAAYTWLGSS